MNSSSIQIHNTLSSKKEPFVSLEPGKVKMYVCGITPYDESHLGHARCYVFFDTIKRFFIKTGYEVTHIQNFTDIDDKIIERANKIHQSPETIANQFIEDYFIRTKLLNILPATVYPRVTQTVPEIVSFIQKLIDKNYAYAIDGDVFYSVRKFNNYGKLSKKSPDELESGARVEINERKNDPLDFALWKKSKPGEPSWNSPWGEGRPGWHIECSVMSINHLGESFDIHGGGQDLIFPHHENEIAQSEGVTGKPFAKYWIHNGFVTVNREKMSKSLGNFFTLKDIFEKFDPNEVRFFLLSRHYRSPLDFSDDLLTQSKNAMYSLNDVYDMAYFVFSRDKNFIPQPVEPLAEFVTPFKNAMADDFNTEKAISVIFNLRSEMIKKINDRNYDWIEKSIHTMKLLCEDFLGIKLKRYNYDPALESVLQTLIRAREDARKTKNWAEADNVRKQLEKMGFIIEDTAWGTRVKKKNNL